MVIKIFGKSDKKTLKAKYESAKIPILILDSEWIQRFSEKHMTDKTKELEASLRECFKQQARLTDAVKKISQLKKSNLDSILKLSGQVINSDSPSAKKEMEKLQAEVVDINESLDNLSLELEKIPLEIDRLNMELLDETVTISHTELAESRTKLESINPEIKRLKIELEYLTQEKQINDEIYQNNYALLNSLLGQEHIEKLDSEYKVKQERGLNGFRARNRHNRNKKSREGDS